MEDYKKKYEEALERAKMEMSKDGMKNDVIAIHLAETIFPELAESKDERIRKELLEHCKNQAKPYIQTGNECPQIQSWIDWLEKQSENYLVNFDEAEQEKYDFVSGQFIECRKSFNEFKEDNSYWLEYIGDDTYIGRSDNILNQKFHITPRQLFTLFTWQHRLKEYSNVNNETNAPTEYGKYVDECLNEASKHFFSEGEDKYSVADLFYAGVRCGKSWFEKQTEQKPSTQLKPKFKVGDWIVDKSGFVQQILDFRGAIYTCTYNSFTVSCESDYHLWTIQDAKDGDVLKEDSCIFILEKMKSQDTAITHCCLFDDGDFDLGSTLSFDINSTYPATKEQRDILFEKMHEAGYEWDDRNKAMTKIEQKPEKNRGNIDRISSNWSEEDSIRLQRIIDFLWYNRKGDTDTIYQQEQDIDWLKSIKDKVQPKQEWSENDDDDAWMNDIISKVENNLQLNKAEIDWLKSIKDRAHLKQEWSEEDEAIAVAIECFIQNSKEDFACNAIHKDDALKWFKSIKETKGGIKLWN